MRKVRKVSALMLVLLLMVTQFFSVTVLAADQTSDAAGVRIVESSYSAGILTVTVQVKIPAADNGFNTVGSIVSYDTTQLTLLDPYDDSVITITDNTKTSVSAVGETESGESTILLTTDRNAAYSVANQDLYKTGDRAALFLSLYHLEGGRPVNPSQITDDWVGAYQLRFRVAGDPADAATVLTSDSIRIADATKDATVAEGAYGWNNYYMTSVASKAGNTYRWERMSGAPTEDFTGNTYLMAAPGNNTATYPGSDREPPKDVPTITTAPTAEAAVFGETLADVALTPGVAEFGGNTVPGTFTWEDTTTSVGAVAGSPRAFEAQFTPNDAATYATVPDISVQVTVGPKTLTDVAVADIPDQSYTGTQITPTATVTGNGGQTLELNTDYTVSYGENRTVLSGGSVEVAPVAGANYTFANVTKNFNITRVAGSIVIDTPPAISYTGQPVSAGKSDVAGVTMTYTYYGDGSASAKFYDDNAGGQGPELLAPPSDAGTYWLGVSATEGDNTAAVDEVAQSFTISPADFSYAYAGSTSVTVNDAYPATDNTVTGNGVGSETVAGELTWFTDAGYTAPASGNFTAEGNTTLYWKFTPAAAAKNYIQTPKTGSADFTVNALPAQVFDPAFAAAASATYGDAGPTRTATLTTGAGAITYASSNTAVATVDPNSGAVTLVGAGSANIVATAAATDTHRLTTTQYTITVAPRQVTVTISATNREYNATNVVALTGAFGAGEIINNDEVFAVVPATGTVVDGSVGNGKEVSYTGQVTLGGAKAGNYVLTAQPTGDVTVDIAAADISSVQPAINGNAAVGETLTAVVTNAAGNELTWTWYQSGNPIAGATGNTYVPVEADSNKAITVSATAVAGGNFTGTTAQSAAVTVAKFPLSGSVTTSIDHSGGSEAGKVDEGDVVTADITAIAPALAQTGGAYQWYRDDVPISGQTGASYTVENMDPGARLRVEYTHPDFAGAVSATEIEVNKLILTGTLSVTGDNEVGKEATADFSNAAVTLGTDYQIVWLRDGSPIPNANRATYTITKYDQGTEVTAKVVGINRYTGDITTTDSLTIPAGKPEMMQMTATPGDGKVTLNWTAPFDGGADITEYVLQVDNHTPIRLSASTLSQTYENLVNGTEYTFKIYAVNAEGNGEVFSVKATPTAAPAPTPAPTPTPPEYTVLEGDSLTVVDPAVGATFRFSILFQNFSGLKIDNQAVDTAQVADVTSGSTIVTLKPSYLRTLAPGRHTITALANDGGSATATFYIGANVVTHVNPQTGVEAHNN